MPDLAIPIDEKFTIHFKKNGGKFLYCDSFREVSDALTNIIEENKWDEHPFFTLNEQLKERFEKVGLQFTKKPNKSEVFFTTCEHLVAQNGSILVSSRQLHEMKLHEVPANVIVFATTSQLVQTIGEGLKVIKTKYKKGIPDNITTIKHFQYSNSEDEDFLTYGSSSKHLYLLLLEDL